MQICYNIEVSLEEGKIWELRGQELAENHVGLIICPGKSFSNNV